MADSRVVGDDVVALSPGGVLLRFSLPEMELEDVVLTRRAHRLSRHERGRRLLAGDAEGGIYRVDVPAMTLTPAVGRSVSSGCCRCVPREPVRAESIVVVTARVDSWRREVHDLGTGRRWELDFLTNRLTIHVYRGLLHVATERLTSVGSGIIPSSADIQ